MYNCSDIKCFVYGAGIQGREIAFRLKKYGYNCLGFIDKSGEVKETDGLNVIHPDELSGYDYDKIFIGSVIHSDSMEKALIDMGVPTKKIDKSFISVPAGARRLFIESFNIQTKNISGAIAELGVYRGDFSKELNEVFSEDLYLFDTFTGVDQRDIEPEDDETKKNIQCGCMGNTSAELVMSRMKNPDRVKIISGYFPETAELIENDIKYKFVYLDVDLYKPTISGLYYFSEHLADGGCILVDDYFDYIFGSSIKKAVSEFLKVQESNGIFWTSIPIGDGTSLALIKR